MKTAAWVVLAALVGAAAWAESGPGGGGGMWNKWNGEGKGRGFNPERMAKELDLSQEQVAQIQELQTAWREQLVPLREASHKAKTDLRELMRKPELTEDELMRAIAVDSAAEYAIAKARAEHFLKMREVLGPEKAATMIEMRGHFRDDERGKGDVPPRRGKD